MTPTLPVATSPLEPTDSVAGWTDAHLWFDPVCPWAWVTSRWLVETAGIRPVRPRWHVMSLAVLNADRDVGEGYRQLLDAAVGPVRVCIAVQQQHGEEALGRFYTELGSSYHDRGAPRDEATISAALAAAGLSPALVAAATDPSFDEAVRTSHEDGINRVGQDVGTPVIAVGDLAFFGPVVTPMPRGEAAGRLWDGVLLVAGTDGFFELKRTRDREPQVAAG